MKTHINLTLSFFCILFSGLYAAAVRAPQVPCAGTIERHEIFSPQLNTNILVDVWLPDDYIVQTGKTYPVIYMQDGQNAFDANGSYAGEWEMDEAVTRLHKEGIRENAVVVGIHCTNNRFGDYSPSKALLENQDLVKKVQQSWGGQIVKGDEYLDFMVNTLRPVIESKYRVRKDLRSVSLIGSSMGGLISLYAICEYPEIFGNAACLSTHWIGALDNSTAPEFPEAVLKYLRENLPADGKHRIYFDHGTEGLDAFYSEWNDQALQIARSKGYTDDYTLSDYVDEGATHNEYFWARRLTKPLEFILGPMLPPANEDAWKYGLPYHLHDGLILHCFDWKLKDITSELPRIAESGFKAVQISPMQRNVKAGDIWYDVYRPSDYHFEDNGMGNREDLRTLCSEAAKYGIKIIVDIVANHGTMPGEAHDPWWDINDRMKYGNQINYSSRYSETHDCLGSYGESNSDDPDVQQRTRNYILELKDIGVSGLRWDAAKHIGLPSEGCDFWTSVLDVPGIWSYGEILGTPAQYPARLKEYADLMWFTNSNGATGSLLGVEKYGISPGRLVHWVESHDTFSNPPYTSQSIAQDEVERRWALTAARADATALYFSRPALGEGYTIKVGRKGGLAFSNKAVAAANHFHNAMSGEPEVFYEKNDTKAVFRVKGVVIVKQGGGEISLPVNNLDPTLNYEDEITGSKFEIREGKIIGEIDAASGIAVVYDYKNSRTSKALVVMDPEVERFDGESCTISLRALNAVKASYSVDGMPAVDFSDKISFEIGKDVAPASDIIISWSAESHSGEKNSGEFKVRKNGEPATVYVYLHFDDAAYANYSWYTFIYNMIGGVNANWPGRDMTEEPSLIVNDIEGGWRVYEVPDDFRDNGLAMVSSSNAGARYPGNGEPGIAISGESLIFFHHGGVWSTGRVESIVGAVETVGVDSCPIAFHVSGGLTVNYPDVDIFNISGRLVKRIVYPETVALAPGVYILRYKGEVMKALVR